MTSRSPSRAVSRALGAAALFAAAAGWTIAPATAADQIKAGRWEFTSQIQLPKMPQLPPGTQLPPGMQMQPGGGMGVTHTGCIDPERAVPTDPRPECRIEHLQRSGATIQWSTLCKTPNGEVRSNGAARYSGDTMEATLLTQVPQPGGQTMTTTQRITGRYLGACQGTPR